MKDDEIEIAVQVNGKTRGTVVSPFQRISKDEAIAAGKEVDSRLAERYIL